ncbi:MAG: hypothetical protein M3P01_10935 [Actinomycetota bacterium]|nr:hypothetical protein [Actinomycetota bacterium]
MKSAQEDQELGRGSGTEAADAGGLPMPTVRGLRVLFVALITSSVVIVAIWGWLAATHIDDRYRIDHVSGVHMALAWDVNHGTLYPPLYDGRTYGGTRYMPLPIVIDAAVARLTGDYLVAGKLLSYAFFLVLLSLLIVLLRKQRCPWALAVGLAGMLLVTETGFAASMDARSDALPVILQVGAVGLVLHRRGPAATVGGAALAALAFVAKVTAVWAPIAIGVWLLVENRRRLLQFAVAYVGFAGALLGAFALASGGRLFENVFGLSGAGLTGVGPLLRSPYRFFHEAIPQAIEAWALVPLVVASVWLMVRRRKLSIWALGLAGYLLVLMVMLADRGVGWNQLIDLVVLTILVVGELAGGASEVPRLRPVAAFIAVTVLWLNITGLAFLFGPEIKKVRDPAFLATITAQPFAGSVDATTSVLAEDPYVSVSLDRRPVVLDPFMFITVAQRDPAALQDLLNRIRAHEFDLVVLRVSLEDPSMASWFEDEAFGSRVADALRANYGNETWVSGYYTYTPLPPPNA